MTSILPTAFSPFPFLLVKKNDMFHPISEDMIRRQCNIGLPLISLQASHNLTDNCSH